MPEYDERYKSKIVLPPPGSAYNIFSLVVQAPDGTITKRRLNGEAYLAIVAATNFKQRVRKMTEYYYADRFNYAVLGTPNLLEYDQGFFVKNGDGAADLKPIAHLYKTQVYQLAEFLERARGDPPSSADDRHLFAAAIAGGVLFLTAVRQDGSVPLRAESWHVSASGCAIAAGLSEAQVEHAYKDIRPSEPRPVTCRNGRC